MTTRTAIRRSAPARPKRTPANRSRVVPAATVAASNAVATSTVAATCTVPSSSTVPVVAIGDVHGCANLLEGELEKHRGSGAELILLGDLIDRAPEPDGDRRVLERIWALQQHPEGWGLAGVTVLRGNHEQMLIEAFEEDEPDAATDVWVWNGGNPALLPFYRRHRAWFEALPLTVIRGDYLFVHAGVRPGVPLEEQQADDLIWIRQPFLNRPHGLPYTVVHGHSITRDHRIDRRSDRINLDTGAFKSGLLSSLTFVISSSPHDDRIR
jgi:serine/threonine protein phosphatase 1